MTLEHVTADSFWLLLWAALIKLVFRRWGGVCSGINSQVMLPVVSMDTGTVLSPRDNGWAVSSCRKSGVRFMLLLL